MNGVFAHKSSNTYVTDSYRLLVYDEKSKRRSSNIITNNKTMTKQLIFGLILFSTPAIAVQEIDCEDAHTTIDINQCAAIELKKAQQTLTRYLGAALQQHDSDKQVTKAIQSAQYDWQNYAHSHCHSVYMQWRDGTIRGVMSLSCRTKLTKVRTYEIWENFLSYMDGSTPTLPEPEF